MSNESFVQVPIDLTDEDALRRFLQKVVEQIDEQILKNYFSGTLDSGWKSGSSFETRASGRTMVNYINLII